MNQAEAAPDILLVSTADWDNPYWTNKQHVAVELGRRGHRVFYIESQGLRRPTATARDLSRIWRRLKRGLRPPRQVRDTVWVLSPIVIPFQSSPTVRKLNRLLLKMMTSLWMFWLGLRPTILWTYSPMTTEFYDIDSYEMVVYHAVDDIKAQPGMPREAIAHAEERLSQRADIIFTTAMALQEAHHKLNPHTHFFPNVAEFDHFHKAMAAETQIPDDLAAIPHPRIGFIGAISGYKLDFDLLRLIAAKRPNCSLVLIGEVGEGDPFTDISSLSDLPNIHFLGGRPYQTLPAYLKGFDLAILPNRLNEYTHSMFPMKFFEYLAAGRPVVVTELPALTNYRHVAAFAGDSASFLSAIDEALEGRGPDLTLRLAAAREQTYEIRTERMMTIVHQRLTEKRR